MITLVVDIETIASTKAENVTYMLNHIKPSGACKSDEAKEKSIKKQAAEVVEKSVFDGTFGEIITISFSLDNNEIITLQRTESVSESDVLQGFFDALIDCVDIRWVAHNASFDLPFIFKRSVINNINTRGIRIPQHDKHGSENLFCTMTEWRGFGAKQGGSLDQIAHVLGLRGKDGVDGSMIAGMFERGEYDAIAQYCKNDVDLTCKIYKRFLICN